MMAFDSLDQLDDDALMLLYAKGDNDAAALLVDRHLPRIVALAHRYTQNRADAEDLAQETMLRLWREARNWEPGRAKLSTWLYRVCTNLCIDQSRKKRAMALDDIAEPEDPADRAETRMIRQDDVNLLDRALAQLPQRQRIAVTLRHIEGCSNPEIAEILGSSIEAVESLTSRGKKQLARIVTDLRNGAAE